MVQVNVDNYQEWIRLVAEYTVQSLKAWQWASGSIHYLLGLWSRLVSSAAYLKGDAPSLLDTFAPKIIEAYVSSRWGQKCGGAECSGRVCHVLHCLHMCACWAASACRPACL